MRVALEGRCQRLLEHVAAGCTTDSGLGTMSTAVYDTAWLAMIQKPPGSGCWLFPESFDYILRHQRADGGWDAYSTIIDGILNTASALLALRKHIGLDVTQDSDLELRSTRAVSALQLMLDDWDVSASDQVGVELLVVKMLALLRDEGVTLYVPQMDKLQELHDAKISRLPAVSIYKRPSTLYHSLEALVGYIDFDQASKWRDADGSMMASPASTAAYLIYASSWDFEAEGYLRRVLERKEGKQDGGVPSAWPSPIFEMTWTISTLAQVGVLPHTTEATHIADFLQQALCSRGGTLGFTPHSLPDADDTAKAIATLRFLGRNVSVDPLITMFEGKDHFRTYEGERNPSFSANCNILICLLTMEDPLPYASQIAKATAFLCDLFFSGNVKDKWHIHDQYWRMLLAHAIALLHERLRGNRELAQAVAEQQSSIMDTVPLISLELLIQTLRAQSVNDGSWGGICESTAYGIMTLHALSQLPWVIHAGVDALQASFQRGQEHLVARPDDWSKAHHLWIEKVTYANPLLSEAYCISAAAAILPALPGSDQSLVASQRTALWENRGSPFDLSPELVRGIQKAGKMWRVIPMFHNLEEFALQAMEIQSCYSFRQLQRHRGDVFDRKGMAEDKYLAFVPLTWMSCSALHPGAVDHYALSEMAILSMLIYQSDEFMEGVVEKDLGGCLDELKSLVRRLCATISRCSPEDDIEEQTATKDALSGAKLVLLKFITCPDYLRGKLAYELETFLLAHITQAEDNSRIRVTNVHGVVKQGQEVQEYEGANRSFYQWVRTTSADHTSCPFAFIFFCCLVGKADPDGGIFATARTAYLAEDMCRSLASMCRMYNDYASVARDGLEGNLNSTNFPEFHRRLQLISKGVRPPSPPPEVSTAGNGTQLHAIKQELMWIAEYERQRMNAAIGQLETELGARGKKTMAALKLYVDVTDLYGLIYLQKDVSTPMQH